MHNAELYEYSGLELITNEAFCGFFGLSSSIKHLIEPPLLCI